MAICRSTIMAASTVPNRCRVNVRGPRCVVHVYRILPLLTPASRRFGMRFRWIA
jgi:hypothetical protein